MAQNRTRRLSRTCDYRIVETTEGYSDFVNKKVRVRLMQEHEEVETIGGFLYDLEGYMLTGKMRGEIVSLPPCKLIAVETRKCTCKAYKFPHAPGFGECKASRFEDEGAPPGMKLEDLFK